MRLEGKKSSDALVAVFLGHKVFKQKLYSLEENQIFVYTAAANFCLSGDMYIFQREGFIFYSQ